MKERSERPKIKISPPKPATPEELEYRRRLVEKTLMLREEIGPIQVSISDLIRAVREDIAEEPPNQEGTEVKRSA